LPSPLSERSDLGDRILCDVGETEHLLDPAASHSLVDRFLDDAGHVHAKRLKAVEEIGLDSRGSLLVDPSAIFMVPATTTASAMAKAQPTQPAKTSAGQGSGENDGASRRRSSGDGAPRRRSSDDGPPRRRSSVQALAAVVRRLSLPSAPPPESPPAQAADMWSFGCLLAFVGTGRPPYSDVVHERATAACGGQNQDDESPSDVYAVLESAQQEGLSPLELLDDVDDCPVAVMAIAEQCVLDAPTARPSAVNVLSRLPRKSREKGDRTSRFSSSARAARTTRRVFASNDGVKAVPLPPPPMSAGIQVTV